jgi:hypothetical protein
VEVAGVTIKTSAHYRVTPLLNAGRRSADT